MALGRRCAKIFLRFEHMDMPIVGHSDGLEHVRRLSNLLQKGKDTGMPDLDCCCMRKPFNSYYLVQDS